MLQRQYEKIFIRYLTIAFLVVMAFPSLCRGEDLAVIYKGQIPAVEEQLIRDSAAFYGLSLARIDVDSPNGLRSLNSAIRASDLKGILLAYDAASSSLEKKLTQIRRRGTDKIPLLVFDIKTGDGQSLGAWSGAQLEDCIVLPENFRPSALRVGEDGELVGLLKGWSLPAVTAPGCALRFRHSKAIRVVLDATGKDVSNAPLLARATGRSDLFFAPEIKLFDNSWRSEPLGTPKAFSYLAPYLLFVKYAAGEYGWHSVSTLANFTIDDPWLVEPYGNLKYGHLLSEMEKHNFHTTIAFIPWNYDRSHVDVVKLVRSHPARFSICIHGDDHSHEEFSGNTGLSIEEQEAKIKQAITRMETFSALTGIPYDRFMVFPHQVAAEPTFAALSKYDFLGTANSQQVPAGLPFPRDVNFLLRPYTSVYGDLLSLFRYSAEVPIDRQAIAIQLFLGNPVLFYAHQQFFGDGPAVFNYVADFINATQPKTRWTSLGEIARHSYLIRKRGERAYDVRMFANEITLQNSTPEDADFYIERTEKTLKEAVVVLGGKSETVEVNGNAIRIHAAIPAGGSTHIFVQYQNDLSLVSANPGKSGTRVWILRHVSDFRDMTLSRSRIGRRLVLAYYRNGWNFVEERWEKRLIVIAILVMVCLGILWIGKRRKERLVSVTRQLAGRNREPDGSRTTDAL